MFSDWPDYPDHYHIFRISLVASPSSWQLGGWKCPSVPVMPWPWPTGLLLIPGILIKRFSHIFFSPNLDCSVFQSCPHIDVRTGPGQHFVFTVEPDAKVSQGTVAFSLPQRKWATLSLNQEIDVSPYQFNPDKHYLSSIILEVDFFNKKNTSTDPFNSDDMAKEFSMQFCKQAFTVGQQCVFNFQDKKLLQIVVKVRKQFCTEFRT